MNKEAIKDFDKAMMCLAVELPEPVFKDIYARWTQFLEASQSPIPGGELYRWVKASERLPDLDAEKYQRHGIVFRNNEKVRIYQLFPMMVKNVQAALGGDLDEWEWLELVTGESEGDGVWDEIKAIGQKHHIGGWVGRFLAELKSKYLLIKK